MNPSLGVYHAFDQDKCGTIKLKNELVNIVTYCYKLLLCLYLDCNDVLMEFGQPFCKKPELPHWGMLKTILLQLADLTVSKRRGTGFRIEIQFAAFHRFLLLFFFMELVET